MRNAGLVMFIAAAMLGVGCGGNDNPVDAGNPDTGSNVGTDAGDVDAYVEPGTDAHVEDPRVTACRAAIAAREAEVGDAVDGYSSADATEMVRDDGDQHLEADYAAYYRDDLTTHPGCVPRESYGNNVEFLVTDNEADVAPGVPANIEGYPCAAKEYTQDAENTDLPIVILVHGNSSSVTSFEEYLSPATAGMSLTRGTVTVNVDTTARPQLASRLIEGGYRVIGFDARTDLVTTVSDYDAATATGNPYRNISHGWAVPMLQSLIRAVINENPTRKIALVGHSLGTTTIRDALRRLYNESVAGAEGSVNPYAHLSDVVLLSGANHGVANGNALCATYPTHMRGTVGCEMGDRSSFVETYFSRPNNGPSDLFAAPCADGSYAFGQRDQCEGNAVEYTTVTMQDIAEGMLQDEYVSEASSGLDLDSCVENVLIGLEDIDTSAYFITAYPALIASHFGSARSNDGIQAILDRLAD